MVTIRERKSFIIICAFIGVFLLISWAQAQQPKGKQPATPRIDERLARQSNRIEQGDREKHLTRDERKILMDNLDYIRGEEARFKAKGELTAAEREHLHRLLDQNSLMIDKREPAKTLRPVVAAPVKEAPVRPGTTVALPKVPTTVAPEKAAATMAPAKPATTVAPAKAAATVAPARVAEPSVPAAKLPAGKKININSASKEELGALPGIGSVKAQAIIDGRPYKKSEDIMKVKGIKQGEFSKIKDLITVE